MIRRTWITRLFAATVAALAVGSQAQAGLLPISVTITPEGDSFRWTYAVVLPTDMKLQSGNYFTIYDFGGYIAGNDQGPEGWTLQVSKNGGIPGRLTPDDDPELDNLTWIYTGETIPSGQIGLGNFWSTSTYGEAKEGFFTAENTRTSDGLIDRNITDVIVPTGEPGGEEPPPGGENPPPGVPEPTTLALAGLGLPLIGLARRLRRNSK